MKNILTLIFVSFILNFWGQVNYSTLDYNTTSGILSDGGFLFNMTQPHSAGYEVPKGSGIDAIFQAAFWFGAIDGAGTLRTAAVRISGDSDLFPGPYSSLNMYSNPSYIAEYSPALWTVSKSEIDYHIANYMNSGYSIPASISDWPGNGYFALGTAQNLAPFVDLNNDNVYSPALGDYPDIRGDKATYIIMNDAADVHQITVSNPLGIEVHIMAYQFSSTNFIDTTTFLNLRVFNRGGNIYSNFRVGFSMDADIGNPNDDYIGCDTSRNLIYTYNADNIDESASGNASYYGSNPPCIGMVSLNNPMNVVGGFSNSASYPHQDPYYAPDYWNYLNGKWENGSSFYYGGLGYTGTNGVTTTPTTYLFSGNPYTGTGWSELTNNNASGDRRCYMSLDSVELNSGDVLCNDFAIIYSRTGDHLENVQGVINTADSVKQFFLTQEFNCSQMTLGESESQPMKVNVFPNPTTGKITITGIPNPSNCAITIHDVYGKILNQDLHWNGKNLEINLGDKKGIYFVNVSANGTSQTFKLSVR